MRAVADDSLDLSTFRARLSQVGRAPSLAVARAGLGLVDGALRIRRGGDGIYATVPRPTTKPAEAIGAWLAALTPAAAAGHRGAELHEALLAAAEEVDAATADVPRAAPLRTALYTDALGTLERSRRSAILPWVIAGTLGGIVIGLLIATLKR